MYAANIYEAAHLCGPAQTDTALDALLDCLFLVSTGESTGGDTYTGVEGPGGEWAIGRDDGNPPPPWMAETCIDPTTEPT